MNITLTKIKIQNKLSEETLCFSADIHLDGKKVGEVSNRGIGGCNEYHWNDNAVGEKIWAHARATETRFNFDQLDTLLDKLITKFEEEKQFKRWCKTKTVFRLKGDKQGEWRTFQVVYNKERHRPQLEKRYPNLEEILNERFA